MNFHLRLYIPIELIDQNRWNSIYILVKSDESISLFQDVLFDIFRALVGYPTIMEKQKKVRESTDLAEYIFLGTNNFSQLQIVKKLELCQDMLINEKWHIFWQKMFR